MNDIHQLSYHDLMKLMGDRRDKSLMQEVRVKFSGMDRGDFYFIVEDTRLHDEQGFNDYTFLFYEHTRLDQPYEAFTFDNMVEAIFHLSYRLVIEECEREDTSNEDVLLKSTLYREAMNNFCSQYT